MKMNKKGFTLIEMLVVIAIIAVLVSIVVPVVGNSTTKAAAAANAANLRTVMAEVATKHLAEPEKYPASTTAYTAKNGVITFSGSGTDAVTVKAPASKAVKVGGYNQEANVQMSVIISEQDVTAYYTADVGTIEKLSIIAETGKAPIAETDKAPS